MERTSGRAATPLYRQVERHLRDQIVSGALSTGDMLPSVRVLCEQFGGINHLTVRQAIKNLTEENLVHSVQGRGSFVSARATSHQRIAIVLPHLEEFLFLQIARGAQEVLAAEGVRNLILDSQGSESVEAEHLATLDNLPVDGALIFPLTFSRIAERIFGLKSREFCFVLVDRHFEDIQTSYVVVDNFQGGYESGRHMAERGRKRVAWMGELGSTPARLRFEGFRAALNDAEIACPRALVNTTEIPPGAPSTYGLAMRQAVFAGVDEFLQTVPEWDALVCLHDAMALLAVERLRERGVPVPGRVAVIGFDDVPGAATCSPPLTTIRQPMNQMGREAATMLLHRMADRNAPVQSRMLPVELVVRDST